MGVHVVAPRACDTLEGALERGVGEGLDLAAVVADEVVVMVAARVRGLEAGDAVADVDALQEAQVGELVDGAVDARDPDPAAAGADPVEDLLGGEATALLAEVLDHGGAGAALAEPRLAQAQQCLLGPRRVSRCHNEMIAVIKDVLVCTRVIARIVLIIVGCVAMTATAAACGGDGPTGGGTSVVAGFYPLAFAAEEIGGAGVTVRDITPAGAEPHDRELTARDVKAVHDADLVLYLGDGFMPALERAVGDRSGPSLDLLDGQTLATGAGGGDALDTHVWLDPVRYAQMARAIGSRLGPAGKAGASALVRRLDALDAEYRQGLATCRRRQIVTSHAAFGYLARRYGLEQVPLEGLSPEAEPSAQALERLVRLVRGSGVTTVFFETLVSPRLAETVAREAGVQTAVLDPLEGLTEDEAAKGADYFSVMRDNLAALRDALGCT